MHNASWKLSSPITPQVDQALSDYMPLMRQLLFNRGYATPYEAEAFIKGYCLFNTSPHRMKGMDESVKRIHAAVSAGELIIVYGDYDADGVTATALLIQVIQAIGGRVRPYIPNRFDEGYGLNTDAMDMLIQDGAKLIITVDCGIRSLREAEYAHVAGLDLIITDHHEPTNKLPVAYAIINPKQPGDDYPEKYLAGVGIAYKVAQALVDSLPISKPKINLDNYLDLVAIGTIADLAPLTGENRILVRAGLIQMRQPSRQGLFSLAKVAGISMASINATHIGFLIGPRLNAAGRLDSALAALDLLITTDVRKAGDLAQKLDTQNRERQELTKKIQDQAETMILNDDPGALLLFAVSPSFNSGVVGLASARLAEKYYRPAIVGQVNEETTRCSCRSIPEFHITHALDQCADLLVRHGGHAAAAGFTVNNENLQSLQDRLKMIALEKLTGADLHPTFVADAEIPLADLKPALLDQLDLLQPTGYGNPEALFISRNVQVKMKRGVGADSKHLKLKITDGRFTFDAIGFRMGEYLETLPEYIDILYTFEANEYNGIISSQLNIKDLRPAEPVI